MTGGAIGWHEAISLILRRVLASQRTYKKKEKNKDTYLYIHGKCVVTSCGERVGRGGRMS